VTDLNWQALTVEGEDRSAIYAETFPARLVEVLAEDPDSAGLMSAFDTTAALEVLATFAGAWGALHEDDRGHRWQYRSIVTAAGGVLVLVFRAVALDPDSRWIAVDDVTRPR
jgi:hypothetical protein